MEITFNIKGKDYFEKAVIMDKLNVSLKEMGFKFIKSSTSGEDVNYLYSLH